MHPAEPHDRSSPLHLVAELELEGVSGFHDSVFGQDLSWHRTNDLVPALSDPFLEKVLEEMAGHLPEDA